jgi:predicted flap endonuclease-1-like 5' DNA nuclease
MDPVLALALLSFGTFVGVCITGLFYIGAIRPSMLEEEADSYSDTSTVSLRTIRERNQAGGENIESLRSAVNELAQMLNQGQDRSSRQMDEYMLKIKEISERINNQNRQIDDISMYLTAELGSQDEALRTIVTQIDTQTGIMANANTILEDLESTGAIAGLARLLSDLGEQVNSMGENLMAQEGLMREVHAQIAPAQASETFYGMMGKQGVQLNDLARQLSNLDTRITSAPPQSEADYAALKRDIDGFGTTLALLNSQLTAQEGNIRSLVDKAESDRSLLSGQDEKISQLVARFAQQPEAPVDESALSEINAILRDQAEKIEALDTRINEQSQILTQTSEASSEHRNLLAGISENLSELVPDIDAISKRKTRILTMPQRLTDIKGIGPVYAGLLHEAGIETFAQLAALSPEELLNLIDVPSWRRINAEDWIAQASLFASQHEKVEKNR